MQCHCMKVQAKLSAVEHDTNVIPEHGDWCEYPRFLRHIALRGGDFQSLFFSCLKCHIQFPLLGKTYCFEAIYVIAIGWYFWSDLSYENWLFASSLGACIHESRLWSLTKGAFLMASVVATRAHPTFGVPWSQLKYLRSPQQRLNFSSLFSCLFTGSSLILEKMFCAPWSGYLQPLPLAISPCAVLFSAMFWAGELVLYLSRSDIIRR